MGLPASCRSRADAKRCAKPDSGNAAGTVGLGTQPLATPLTAPFMPLATFHPARPDTRSPRSVRDRRVHVRSGCARLLEAGDPRGQPVVLLHGLGALGEEMMQSLGPSLAARGLRVLAVDRPGYGFSDALPDRRRGPRAQARWLEDVLGRLGLRRPILVAHSSGAAVALALACRRRHPLAGLVLLSPFARPTRPAPMPLLRLATLPGLGRPVRRAVWLAAPWIGPRLLAAAEGGPTPGPKPDDLPWRRMARGRAILAMRDELMAFNRDMVALRTALKRIDCPAVVLAGTRDPVLSMPPQVSWIAHRIRQAEVTWCPGAGHRVHQDHPALVAEAVVGMTPCAGHVPGGRAQEKQPAGPAPCTITAPRR